MKLFFQNFLWGYRTCSDMSTRIIVTEKLQLTNKPGHWKPLITPKTASDFRLIKGQRLAYFVKILKTCSWLFSQNIYLLQIPIRLPFARRRRKRLSNGELWLSTGNVEIGPFFQFLALFKFNLSQRQSDWSCHARNNQNYESYSNWLNVNCCC